MEPTSIRAVLEALRAPTTDQMASKITAEAMTTPPQPPCPLATLAALLARSMELGLGKFSQPLGQSCFQKPHDYSWQHPTVRLQANFTADDHESPQRSLALVEVWHQGGSVSLPGKHGAAVSQAARAALKAQLQQEHLEQEQANLRRAEQAVQALLNSAPNPEEDPYDPDDPRWDEDY